MIVVDDASDDGTPEIAEARGAKVLAAGAVALRRRRAEPRLGGGARRRGRVPRRRRRSRGGLGRGRPRGQLDEFPGAVVARRPHLHGATRAGAGSRTWRSRRRSCREVPRASGRRSRPSACCVPREAPLRWHESYGGEDGLFCVDALRGRPAARVRPALLTRSTTTGARASASCAASSGGRLRLRPRTGAARRAALPPALAAVSAPLLRLVRLPVIYSRIRDDPRAARPLPAPAPLARRRRVAVRPERVPLRPAHGPDTRDPARTFG